MMSKVNQHSLRRVTGAVFLALIIQGCGAGQSEDIAAESSDTISVPTASASSIDLPAIGAAQGLTAEPQDGNVIEAGTSNSINSIDIPATSGQVLPEPDNSVEGDVGTVPDLSSELTAEEAAIEVAPIEEAAIEEVAIEEVAIEVAPVNETFSPDESEDAASPALITGCVGNLVWGDENANGIKESSEGGVEINKIDLLSLQGDVLDSVATETGYYQLCNVPGKYRIRVELPSGYAVTSKDSGQSDTADSDADENGEMDVEIFANKNKTKFDVGLIAQSGIPNSTNTNLPVTVPLVTTQPEVNTPSSEEPDVVTPPVVVNPPSNTNPIKVEDLRWGFWTETRNAYDTSLGASDEGVETTFDNYSFAHVKALSLSALGGDTLDKQYVVNILEAATRTNTSLDLQLGSAGEYGWNFSTGRGNFNLDRWKTAVGKFGAAVDPVAYQAIVAAIDSGIIRYIFLIDEPNHKRWSPAWDGTHGSEAPGNANHVSNQDLDEMAAHVKSEFGDDTKTIVRTSPINLTAAARQGMYVFQHMTHAYLTISSTKWTAGSDKGPNKGLEWFLTIKNNNDDNVTNFTAFNATNLRPSIMLQAGFQSTGNPWTGEKNFEEQWWQGNIQYPYNGKTGYVKSAPGELDYWVKSLLSPRDAITGVLSDSGVRWFNDFVIFRADRLPTDNGKLPFSSYPHYTSFLDGLRNDMDANNLNPIIGIPVGWTGN